MVLLFIAILIMALLQVIGIASILPFMQIVAEPQAISQNEFLIWIQNQLGINGARSMLIATGLGVFVLIILGNSFSALTVWLQHKYSWEIAHNISTRLLRSYLQRPYEYFLGINTSILLNKILVEVARFTREVLIQLIEFSARSIVVLVIFGLLVWVNPHLALIALGAFGMAYLIIYNFTHRYLSDQGKNRTKGNERLFKSLNEALTGIKTIKVYGAESLFYRRYETASSYLINIYPRVKLISDTPRYLIEILAFGGILGTILFLLITGESVQDILPVLSLYAVAGYRLLPSLQKAFAAISTLRHSFDSLEKIYQDLNEASLSGYDPHGTGQEATVPPLSDKIILNNLVFDYGDKPVFNNLNIQIKRGTTVAFVGPTGSGKSTLIDLIVGQLEPQQGTIQIDNTSLDRSTVRSWNHQIGYVPQEVFLFDDTISRNIAMTFEDEGIKMEQVEYAARTANIHQFITSELPKGYQQEVGDRGVRLSGGQKQRIGLARAFYRNPKLLILDEATNALDSITESAVVESLKQLEDLTVIIIAHRLSMVRHADHIFLLQDGKIIDEGNYDLLLDNNKMFREMAQVTLK